MCRMVSSYQIAFNLVYKRNIVTQQKEIEKKSIYKELLIFENIINKYCSRPVITESNSCDIFNALDNYRYCFNKNKDNDAYSLDQKYANENYLNKINSIVDTDILHAINMYFKK